MCSFRTPVNVIFAKLTDRPYKVTEVTYADTFIILWWIVYIIVYFIYSQEQYLHEFFVEAKIVDTQDPMEIFAGYQLF